MPYETLYHYWIYLQQYYIRKQTKRKTRPISVHQSTSQLGQNLSYVGFDFNFYCSTNIPISTFSIENCNQRERKLKITPLTLSANQKLYIIYQKSAPKSFIHLCKSAHYPVVWRCYGVKKVLPAPTNSHSKSQSPVYQTVNWLKLYVDIWFQCDLIKTWALTTYLATGWTKKFYFHTDQYIFLS